MAIEMPKLPPKLHRHLNVEAAWLPPSCLSWSMRLLLATPWMLSRSLNIATLWRNGRTSKSRRLLALFYLLNPAQPTTAGRFQKDMLG